MATEADFEAAVAQSKTLSSRPSNDVLLKLYSLYKQATTGDATGKRPSAFKMKDRAKFDAWTGQKGKSQDDARTEYVALVTRLAGQ